jgi:hypothetical protein
MSANLLWMRREVEFCTTGAVFSQPLRDGLLRPGYFASDCGSLDAPNYIPLGGTRVSLSTYADGALHGYDGFAQEIAGGDREQMADDAAREPFDDGDYYDYAADEDLQAEPRPLPRIEFSYQCLGMWVAVFDGEYDGAPDAHGLLGHGTSKEAAMDALIERALDSGRINEEEAGMLRAVEVAR